MFTVKMNYAKVALRFASNDATRVNLCGVYFEVSKGVRRTVATDGHRMAVWEAPCDVKEPDNSAFVPRFALEHAIAAWCGDELAVGQLNEHMTLQSVPSSKGDSRERITSTVGVFPSWQQIVPGAGGNRVVRGSSAAFRKALKGLDAKQGIRLSCLDGQVWLGVLLEETDALTGSNWREVRVPNVTYDGDMSGRFDIGVNAKYLDSCLREVSTVQLELCSELDPIVFREGRNVFLTMPMRI